MNFIVDLNEYRVTDEDLLFRLNPPSLQPMVRKPAPKTKGKKPKAVSKPSKNISYDFEPLLCLFTDEKISLIESKISEYLISDLEKFTIDDTVIAYIGGYKGDEINIQLGLDGNFYLSYVNYTVMKSIWFAFSDKEIDELFKFLVIEDINEKDIVEENLEDIMKKGGN